MLRLVPLWRTPWSVLLAAAGTAGCMEMGAAAGDRVSREVATLFKSPAKLPPCSLATTDYTEFVDSPLISRWAYDGRTRPRAEVAVLFVRSTLSPGLA
jgi:hypothetical protein